MKAKIYPLNKMIEEVTIPCSPLYTMVSIVSASLAKGTSIIKNTVESSDIEMAIKWCESLGASIKKSSNHFIIKGIDQHLQFKESLFDAKDSLNAAIILIPILCSIDQPFGIKGSKRVMKGLQELSPILSKYGIECYEEGKLIRFEGKIKPLDLEIDGENEILFVAGLMIACTLIEGNSTIRLRAPIRYEKTYSSILHILKKFKVEIKHPSTMKYEIQGPAKYKHGIVNNKADNLIACYYLMLTRKLDNNLKIDNFKRVNKYIDDYSVLDYVKNYAVSQSRMIKNVYSFTNKEIDAPESFMNSEDKIPTLMVFGTLASKKLVIRKLHLERKKNKAQYDTMVEAFRKLEIPFLEIEDGIVIKNHICNKKVQVDCNGDPQVAIALSYLALLSDEPLIIRGVECVSRYNSSIFEGIKELGARIEFIHD